MHRNAPAAAFRIGPKMTETKILTLLSHDKWLDVADYIVFLLTIENIRHVDNPEDLKF